MNRNRFIQKGSLSIEAAVSLGALFVISFFLVLLIKGQYFSEVMDQGLFEAAKTVQIVLGPKESSDFMNKIYFREAAKKRFNEVVEGKGINPKLCKIDMDILDGHEIILRGEIRFEMGAKVLFKDMRNYHIIGCGIYVDQKDNDFSVSVYGERYHKSGCHTISGREGVKTMKLQDAFDAGKTPCGICIGGKLFGKLFAN